MVQIDLTYDGNLRCTAKHGDSGTTLITDAPKDNQGNGESFSPTDLVATALGTCIATTMAIVARRHDIELKGIRATVQKEMVATPKRRIGKLTVEMHCPKSVPEEFRARLEQAGLACPVHQSLHPDVAMPITFVWDVE